MTSEKRAKKIYIKRRTTSEQRESIYSISTRHRSDNQDYRVYVYAAECELVPSMRFITVHKVTYFFFFFFFAQATTAEASAFAAI